MGLRPTSPTRPITPEYPRSKQPSRFGMWQKLQHFFGRDEATLCMEPDEDIAWPMPNQSKSLQGRDGSCARPVGISLPRQGTFKRQNSEKRDRLCPHEPTIQERRAYSMCRRPVSSVSANFRSKSVPTTALSARCPVAVARTRSAASGSSSNHANTVQTDDQIPAESQQHSEYDGQRPPRPMSITSSSDLSDDQADYFEDRDQLNHELDTKWILNLSMHFRDKSDREKFFVTYAETPCHWRRVTVSCDYRHAKQGSLEMDLKELQLQRDKSMQIYEAVRESLLEIKFYDTVTNLKLETSDGRLHVHVTEDVNEIIPYPPIGSLQHVLHDTANRPKLIRESELSFEAHLSGFVYKVRYQNRAYIKKEIPGPDTVDEFLYEVNALHALQNSQYVIDLEAIITDESGELIKGLLIDYAERGAVVDLLYDEKGEIPWEDRERWARHAIQGLSDIHEEGYVQGDFTLSNVVVDKHNNARIIDINRRGCPVGWEPPEIACKIASNQRISMYIGQKSDLYQLGMTLWALAMDDDEPERHDPPLSTQEFPSNVPGWYQGVVRVCLSLQPRKRRSATDLINEFPPVNCLVSEESHISRSTIQTRTEKRYIDPAADVSRDDLERFRYERNQYDEILYSPESSREDPSYTWPQSSNYDREYDDATSEIERPRGRRRISNHDRMLRERQQQDTRLRTPSPLVNSFQDHQIPLIALTNDGTETFIDDMDDRVPPAQVEHTLGQPESMATPLPFFGQPQHRRRIYASSETSNETPTPRNGNSHAPSSEVQRPQRPGSIAPSDDVSGYLTELGSHHNASEHSLGQIHGSGNDRIEHLASPLPSFQSRDSGFDEPTKFEIEMQNSADEKLQDFNSSMIDGPSADQEASKTQNPDNEVLDTDVVASSHTKNHLLEPGDGEGDTENVARGLEIAAARCTELSSKSADTSRLEASSIETKLSAADIRNGAARDTAITTDSNYQQDHT